MLDLLNYMDIKLQKRFDKINLGVASKDFVKNTIILRYPKTNAIFDACNKKRGKFNVIYKAFCYARGIPVYLKDGSLEMNLASGMMTGPSVAIQVLKYIKVDKNLSIVEGFCGVGYFTIFLSLFKPKSLICIDKFTPNIYDLKRTFNGGLSYIFGKQIPPHTQPKWFQSDVTKKQPFKDQSVDKIFLHPPFGNAQSKFLPTISEDKAIDIWLTSVINLKCLLKNKNSEIVSVVPSKWISILQDKLLKDMVHQVIQLDEVQQFPTSIVITKLVSKN